MVSFARAFPGSRCILPSDVPSASGPLAGSRGVFPISGRAPACSCRVGHLQTNSTAPPPPPKSLSSRVGLRPSR
ncbi:hypothetical protein BC826DRAFT_1049491 [Russula brevipes]|nr:hypothetical protein BC826DRAFT_1083692 [Russula brevipes]KAI0286271.1 hypothetical protein BC826DRAFT_1049491 [Russula brevipes]